MHKYSTFCRPEILRRPAVGHGTSQHCPARKPLQPHPFEREPEPVAQLSVNNKPVPAVPDLIAVHHSARSHSGR
jgi:hypothetical protein